MESLNLNELLTREVSETIEGPSSPILSNNKINRRVISNRKFKKRKSKVNLVDQFVQEKQENLDGAEGNISPGSQLKNVEQLEKEREVYYHMACQAFPNFKIYDFKDSNRAYNKPLLLPIQQNIKTFCDERPKICSDYIVECTNIQTASGKQIEISENVINEHKHIFDDIFDEEQHPDPAVLKCSVNPSMKKMSKIPVFNRNIMPKSNDTHPRIEEKSFNFEKMVHTPQTTKEIVYVDVNHSIGVSNEIELAHAEPANNVISNIQSLSKEVSTIGKEQNLKFEFMESVSSVHTMNKLYSNQQFEEFSSSTNSLGNFLCNDPVLDESEISTELSQMYSTAIENRSDLENKDEITYTSICTESSTMDNNNLNDVLQVAKTNAIKDNPFVELKFTKSEEVDKNGQCTSKAIDCCGQNKVDNDCDLHSEQTNSRITTNQNICHNTKERDSIQNKVLGILGNVQCNISSLETHNLLLHYNQQPVDSKEGPPDNQQNSLCSSKSIIRVNIPTNNFNCKEKTLHSQNLIELHRNRNFTGYSEDSTSNLDYKLSQHSIKVRKRTVQAQKKMISADFLGFDKNTQKLANEQAIVYVNNIKEIEKKIHNTELIIQSKGKDEKKMRDKKSKRHNFDHCDEKDKDDQSLVKDAKVKSEKKRKEREKPKQNKLKVVKEEVCENGVKEVTINEKKNRTVIYDHLSLNSEASCKKYKEHKKRKAVITDKEIIQQNRNPIIEFSPNQKKFKIEIDMTKCHINICCNAPQCMCEKEAMKCDKVCKNEMEPIRCTDAKFSYDAAGSTIARVMFKSASGKDIMLNKKLLNDAEEKFEQIDTQFDKSEKDDLQVKKEVISLTNNCESVNSHGNEKDKLLNKFINKASKFYHDITKSDYQQVKKSDKSKEISGNKETTQIVSKFCQGALPNNLCGFKSASGKQMRISEKGLKSAKKIYQDIENSLNKDIKDIDCNKDNSSYNKVANVLEKEKRKTRVLYADMNNTNPNTRPNVPSGYSVISGKLVKDSEKKKTLTPKEQGNDSKLPLDATTTNNMLCGFQSASGKNIKMSAAALEQAKRVFDESKSPAGDSTYQATFSDFRSPRDTNPGQLEKQLSLANHKYKDCDTTKLCMGDFEKSDLGKIEEIKDNEMALSPNDTTSKNAFQLLEDVAETVDCALEKIKKDRLQISSNARRRLGISRCKQINISREKIDKARRLFSNESFANSIRDASVLVTPKASQTVSSSTPLRSTSQFKSIDFFKNVVESEITPIKAIVPEPESSVAGIDGLTVIMQKKTAGTLDDWYGTVLKQINLLRDELKALDDKKCSLEKQMSFIHYGSKEHRKQRSGILFSKKSLNNEKISLKVLEISEDVKDVERAFLKVSPENADMIHFNFTGLASTSVTQDGAIIIPNSEHLVGLSEIEIAFKTMVGVDPDLIPKGWIANHYRLIVWKLASYERFASRQLQGVLSVENIIQQLKYRYDREIDRAERPALRKILEKDDVSQKRMILCVSDIVEVSNTIELELTDGWYCIRTIIDEPLTTEVSRRKIKIGSKLIVYGTQLLNCDGCHPLQVTDLVKLKINYNCTRRAIWYAKLGYQRCPQPFAVPLSSIHPRGGLIGCLKLHILRVYPMRYMEQVNNRKVWRNRKAEEKYANIFENERLEQIEKIHYSVQDKYDQEMGLQNKYIEQTKLNEIDILKINCPKTLYKLLEGSNDPDSLLEILSPSQRVGILEYRQQISLQREQEITKRISEEIKKLKLIKRNVTPVLKLLVLDNYCDSENIRQFSIWNPKDEMLLLKEGSSVISYNIVPGYNGSLSSHPKTYFKADEKSFSHTKFKRQLFPISMTLDPHCKPLLNEFDTIGLVIQIDISSHDQRLWLTETTGIMLFVSIKDDPAICSLLDAITKGQVVSLVNLIHCKPQKDFGQAIANQFTIISTCPQENYLREGIELFKMKLPEDTSQLLRICEQNIEKYTGKIDVKQKFAVTSFTRPNCTDTLSDICDISDDDTMISSQLTATDVAMSLIDIDKFT